jgi:membrane-bound ClpP family serine protease
MNTTAPHGAIGSRARRMGCLTSTGLPVGQSGMCSIPCDLQGNSHTCSAHAGSVMITLGVILLIVGFLIKIPILWTIGIIVLIIGLVLLAMGSMGRAVGGRRHYY